MDAPGTQPDTDPSTPHPSALDGEQPGTIDDDGADVLFPDAMRPRSYEDALPRGDDRDVAEQQAPVADPDDGEDEPRD